jgi:hypothetical protein
MAASPRLLSQSLVLPLVFLLLLRLFFQSSFPVLGDEAYYFYWGHHFAGGYYDLPPMVGWWERFFTFFSDHPFWLRLPNLISLVVVGFGLREWMAIHTSRSKAVTTTLLYLVSPLPFLAVLVSHDVLLLFFTFFSALLFFQAGQSKNSWKEFLFSGVLWGAGFLSKYFAVFILPFYLIWHFTRKKGHRPLFGMIWFALGASPFLLQHLHWNANHCWANFVFNLVTRQKASDGTVFQTFGLYVVYLLLLVTPVFWMDLFKTPIRKWFQKRSTLESFALGMWLVPISIFGITALMGRGQGLHWYFPYLPFFFMWVGIRFPLEELQFKLRSMTYFTYALAMIIAIGLFFPDSVVRRFVPERFSLDYEIAFHGDEWVEKIAGELNTPNWGEVDLVVTDGYSQASVLDHRMRLLLKKNHIGDRSIVPPVTVWDHGSRFGRVFDWTVNFLEFEGKNLALVSRSPLPSYRWEPYFQNHHQISKEVNGIQFWITLGRGFRARKYVEEVMVPNWKNAYPPFFLENQITSRCELRG